MWHVWKKYGRIFFLLLVFSCNNTNTQELQKKLLLTDSLLKNYTGKVPILSEVECIGCSLNKSVYAIRKKIKSSDSIKIMIYHNSKNKNSIDTQKLREFFPQVASYVFTKNLDIMINLAETTKIKAGPYYLEYEKGKIKSVESLGR